MKNEPGRKQAKPCQRFIILYDICIGNRMNAGAFRDLRVMF